MMGTTSQENEDASLADLSDIRFNPPLYEQRYQEIARVAREYQPKKVVDIGCGELSVIRLLKFHKSIHELIGLDVDGDLLRQRVFLIQPLPACFLSPLPHPFAITLLQGSIAERDGRLLNCDLAVCVEVIEHLYPDNVTKATEVIFGYMRPRRAVFTTPNSEFNVLFPGLQGFRHDDHKFEWTRKEFQDWGNAVCLEFGYTVEYSGLGSGPPGTENLGFCTQTAVFEIVSQNAESVTEPVEECEQPRPYLEVAREEYPFEIPSENLDEEILYEACYRVRQLLADVRSDLDEESGCFDDASDDDDVPQWVRERLAAQDKEGELGRGNGSHNLSGKGRTNDGSSCDEKESREDDIGKDGDGRAAGLADRGVQWTEGQRMMIDCKKRAENQTEESHQSEGEVVEVTESELVERGNCFQQMKDNTDSETRKEVDAQCQPELGKARAMHENDHINKVEQIAGNIPCLSFRSGGDAISCRRNDETGESVGIVCGALPTGNCVYERVNLEDRGTDLEGQSECDVIGKKHMCLNIEHSSTKPVLPETQVAIGATGGGSLPNSAEISQLACGSHVNIPSRTPEGDYVLDIEHNLLRSEWEEFRPSADGVECGMTFYGQCEKGFPQREREYALEELKVSIPASRLMRFPSMQKLCPSSVKLREVLVASGKFTLTEGGAAIICDLYEQESDSELAKEDWEGWKDDCDDGHAQENLETACDVEDWHGEINQAGGVEESWD